MATTKFKGQPVKIIGEFIKVGLRVSKNRSFFFLFERFER